MTNFESAARNTLLWRVPGQSLASQGHNERLVEMLDLFPTIVDLAGLPPLPTCQGLDQPPGVICLQGTSYAAEFATTNESTRITDGSGNNVSGADSGGGLHAAIVDAKEYAFTQWPFPKWGNRTALRMGYTVRTMDGYRLTEYVYYNLDVFRGEWRQGTDDVELYDYNTDPWETTNHASSESYAPIVNRLRAVLRQQYAPDLATAMA